MSSAALQAVGEAAFTRRLRSTALPVVALLRAPGCAASRALAPLVAEQAARHAGRLVALSLDAERAPLVAERYAVSATPTLLALRDGEPLTRVVGYLPAGLLQLLCEEIVTAEAGLDMAWSPVERVYEDVVLLPLLDAWGWRYERQVRCTARSGKAAYDWVDVLAYDLAGAPLTLFENKRRLTARDSLAEATAQARSYAQALGLRSFVVAAPPGMWVYALRDGHERLAGAFSALEIAARPDAIRRLLLRLA